MKKILFLFACLFCFSSVCVNAAFLEETLNGNNNSRDSWEELIKNSPGMIEYKESSVAKFGKGLFVGIDSLMGTPEKELNKYSLPETIKSVEFQLGKGMGQSFPIIIVIAVLYWFFNPKKKEE